MFIPHTDNDRERMLESIGIDKIEDLFSYIPQKDLFPNLNLPSPLSEQEAYREIKAISESNETTEDLLSFLGAGAYNHYVPAVVDSIIQRGEFLTAYTPYQAEVSQGTLQAIFDYQSLVTALTGMDVSNASHYDGATATAEAVGLADAVFRGKRKKVIISPSLNPQYLETLITYNSGSDLEFVQPDLNLKSDKHENINPFLDENTALIIVQYPDFFGRIYDYSRLVEVVHENGSLICVVVNPLTLGLLKPPGEFGADIVVGEGQTLGLPLSFGGPYLGIFATRNKFVRKMAGRLVGETVDKDGKRAFVLTLTAREQHIRRERATSNICTNQGIMALASTVYMSLLGIHGMKQVGDLNYQKAHYAAAQITKIEGFELWSSEPFFNEFAIKCPISTFELNKRLLDEGIIGGFDLGNYYPGLENVLLIAVTEMIDRKEIDYFCQKLEEVSHD